MNSKKSKMKMISDLIFIGLMLVFQASVFAQDLTIEIDVSPNVLNLNNQGEVVTVHTDIAYNLVVGATVALNGVEIDWWKSDDRGNFVAKFVMEEIKDLPLIIGEYNTLTMVGQTAGGATFKGTQEIKVIEVIPKKE